MTCSAMDVEAVHNVLSVMQKNLECPICLDLMKEPVATRCDHMFCRYCMLQLLSKKKKGRAQCPMCKKEITKRSLQDSPRFQLLVDGLLKIINAFELDSGYKFFPSQDYASTVTANYKETPKKDEQAVVQSTGYRNRTKSGIVNRGRCEGQLSLLETSTDTHLAGDTETRNCKQPKRQKKENKQLITDFVSDSSEDDLFKKAGSLGSDVDEPYMLCEPGVSLEPEKKEDSLMANEANDEVSSKPESDVAASDLAEYGFSEKDLESIRSNFFFIDGVRNLKESPSEKSAVIRDPLISDLDFCENAAEQGTHVKLDENVRKSKLTELHANMQIVRQQYSESQTFKIAIDDQYDRDDSTPENMGSTQGSPRDASCAVSRQRLKKSIKKVNEWLLKTDELLNNSSSRDDQLLPDVSRLEDQVASDKGSSVSDETEIMAVSHRHVMADAFEKSMVSVEDKIFGRVYKREKKPNQVGKVTCVADVHIDGAVEPLKTNEVPKSASLKPKRSTGLQPEHFIKKIEENKQNSDRNINGPVVVEDFGLDTDSNLQQMKAANALFVDADKIEVVGQDLETVSDAQSSKPKKQKKSLKRKSEKTQGTRIMQSLHLTKGANVDSCQQQSPLRSMEVNIDSYPSSTEPGHEVNQKNVRRSKRLHLSKENDFPYSATPIATHTNSKDIRNGGPQIEDPPNDISTLINCEEPCLHVAVSEEQRPQITGTSPLNSIAVQIMTGGNGSSYMECDPVCVTQDLCKGSSPIPEQNVETVVNAEEMEDSDLDTQLLLKTFKSVKRMSFKLDPVTKTADKENSDPIDVPDVGTSLRNGQQDKDSKGKHSSDQSLYKPNEVPHSQSQFKSFQENQPEHSRKLRSKKNYSSSSEHTVQSSAKNTDNLTVHMTSTIPTNGQLNDLNPIKDVKHLKKFNPAKNAAVSKSEGPPLHLETQSMSLYPVVTHQNPASAMRGDTRSEIGQGENEQARNDYQKCNFDEEQENQITSSNSSQGSMTGKLLGHLASHDSSPDKSPEVYFDTPDGLLGTIDRHREDARCCAITEKSFVFGDGMKSQLVNHSVSPSNQSQVVRRRKRGAHKLDSSEEESSGDEELPCFNALFAKTSTIADLKNASASSSPKQQGGGVLAMFSSCSTSGKTQTSLNLPREALLCSQESQYSVNLFSSQSNTSDQSINGARDRAGTRSQYRPLESSPKRAGVGEYCNEEEMGNVEKEAEEMANVENDCEDPCQEHNLGEVSGCESEASHTGDSSGLSSQCEILNTQQRDTMQNNLEKLQIEMAALEAVLEQHGSQRLVSGREQTSTAEHVTIRPQEAQEEQTDYEGNGSPDAIPETEIQSGQSRASGLQRNKTPSPFGSRSPTPPLSLPQTTSRRETQEKICTLLNAFKELKESTTPDDESMGYNGEDGLHTQEQDRCAPTIIDLKNSKSPPKLSLRSKLQAVNGHSTFRKGSSGQSTELRDIMHPPRHSSKHPGCTQRSVSPTFTSPLRSRAAPSVKSPVVSSKRNYSLVTSGLSQSEVILVQKFARKTQSVFSSQITESSTHIIMKTDEQFVCERTLKYFLGIAGRKWVVSYEWIVQSFREGRILDEYDFEVKGDVINGRNHRGPRRSRLGSDGLLLEEFEICCPGSFKDMTKDDLEWMASLCGASVAHDPSQFEHKSGTTSLVVVQPDKETDYAAMRKRNQCLVITREWLLDSVSNYKLQAFDSYLV
ncbi:breast cancer type 1 susceptibility protein [Rhinoderma darwinii]|uniref:breast cancer type 1 susceptibility protein n=1 Tax=Rhinoderma darwinii TaxID=43563 RepID=UPI003F666478